MVDHPLDNDVEKLRLEVQQLREEVERSPTVTVLPKSGFYTYVMSCTQVLTLICVLIGISLLYANEAHTKKTSKILEDLAANLEIYED